MVGGQPPSRDIVNADGRGTRMDDIGWRISSAELDAVLDFAEKSQRFCSKARE
jgi:hypothetical protein